MNLAAADKAGMEKCDWQTGHIQGHISEVVAVAIATEATAAASEHILLSKHNHTKRSVLQREFAAARKGCCLYANAAQSGPLQPHGPGFQMGIRHSAHC